MTKTPGELELEQLRHLDEFERAFEANMEPWVAGNVFFASRPRSDQVRFCSYFVERRNYLNLYDGVASWLAAQNLPRFGSRLRELKGKFDELMPLMFSPAMKTSYQPYLPPAQPVRLPPSSARQAASFNQDMARIMRGMQEDQRLHQERMYRMQQAMTKSINSFPT